MKSSEPRAYGIGADLLGEFNRKFKPRITYKGEYLSAAATGALSAVISPAKCAENVAKRMVKSGLKEAAIGAVGDGIKQLADGEFDPKEMAINAGKNFVSGALNGKFNASCFAAGTMIETADGDRPIEEIQIGDLVLSANPETGEIAYKPVVNTYVHVTDTVLYLTIDEEIIETTKIAIPFEGNKKAYRSYIKQLNKGNKR